MKSLNIENKGWTQSLDMKNEKKTQERKIHMHLNKDEILHFLIEFHCWRLKTDNDILKPKCIYKLHTTLQFLVLDLSFQEIKVNYLGKPIYNHNLKFAFKSNYNNIELWMATIKNLNISKYLS